MVDVPPIRLAGCADAAEIAAMSRDLIEAGLGWRWTAPRVARAIAAADNNGVVANHGTRIGGFGIMTYGVDDAHLLLLAVRPACARRGIGGALVGWLEASARVAGIGRVKVEARLGNHAARAFYARLGYREIERVPGYYSGRETSVRLAKDLRLPRSTRA